MDGNRCVHLISAAHIMCGECMWGYENLFAIEKEAFSSTSSSPLIGAKRVTIIDGGIALQSALRKSYPGNTIMRCRRHLIQDLKNSGVSGKSAIGCLLKIQNLPRPELEKVSKSASYLICELIVHVRLRKAQRHLYIAFLEAKPASRVAVVPQAKDELSKLAAKNINAHAHLASMPLQQICPAALPLGVCAFGETTNNAAEVFMHMSYTVRFERSFLGSLMRLDKVVSQRLQLLLNARPQIDPLQVTHVNTPNKGFILNRAWNASSDKFNLTLCLRPYDALVLH